MTPKKSPKVSSSRDKLSPSKRGSSAITPKKLVNSPTGSRELQECNYINFKIDAFYTYEHVGTEFRVSLEYDGSVLMDGVIVSTQQCEDIEEKTESLLLSKTSLHKEPEPSFHTQNASMSNVVEDVKSLSNDVIPVIEDLRLKAEYGFDSTDSMKMCHLANEVVVIAVKRPVADIHYPSECIIDILPLLKGDADVIKFNKHLQPAKHIPVIDLKSWDNLPMISVEVTACRQPWLEVHDKLLQAAITAEFKVIGICNAPGLLKQNKYSLTTFVPVPNEPHMQSLTLENPRDIPLKSFNQFFNWHSLQTAGRFLTEDLTTKLDFDCFKYKEPDDIQKITGTLDTITRDTQFLFWSSVFRTLVLPAHKSQFQERLKFRWPFILSNSSQEGTKTNVLLDYRGIGDFTELLKPGVKHIRKAVVLDSLTISTMAFECGLFDPFIVDELLLKCVKPVISHGKKFGSALSVNTSTESTDSTNKMILFFEIELSECLFDIEPEKPLPEDPKTLQERLKLMEKLAEVGEGENIATWKSIVDRTCTIISSQIVFGTADFCTLTKYLCNTPFWLELKSVILNSAAKNIADIYNIQDYMCAEEGLKELVRTANITLTTAAFNALHGKEVEMMHNERELRAARHAKKLMHFKHARELLLLCIVRDPNNALLWRELGTHLRTTCRSTAIFCYIKSLELEPRNALTILCLGSAVYEEDPQEAEPFFFALIQLHPNWAPGLIATHCYLNKRELYEVAGMIVFLMADNMDQFWSKFSSYLGGELDDWWSLSGLTSSSIFIRTADLLLRIRACDLAEVCLSREMILYGESLEYLFILALSRAIRGEQRSAIKICKLTREKYGDFAFMHNLESQCNFLIHGEEQEFNLEGALFNAYRLPSAYNWSRVAKALRVSNRRYEAELVAIHALRIDRTEKYAWRELALAVLNQPERSKFYMQQAERCTEHFECFCDYDCAGDIVPTPSLYK